MGSQTLDRNQDWIDWKNEYSNKFKELSEVAKLSASHIYLEGVLTMGDDLLMKKSANWRRVFPPVSKTKGEASTLDNRFVQEFFTEYNDIIADVKLRRDLLDKEGIDIPTFAGIGQIIRSICG